MREPETFHMVTACLPFLAVPPRLTKERSLFAPHIPSCSLQGSHGDWPSAEPISTVQEHKEEAYLVSRQLEQMLPQSFWKRKQVLLELTHWNKWSIKFHLKTVFTNYLQCKRPCVKSYIKIKLAQFPFIMANFVTDGRTLFHQRSH